MSNLLLIYKPSSTKYTTASSVSTNIHSGLFTTLSPSIELSEFI